MGLASLFKKPALDINRFPALLGEAKGSVLADVREADEFARGHVPGSINWPLSRLEEACAQGDTAAPVYVYCQTGRRSLQAALRLKQLGFSRVTDLGGIGRYRGTLEK